jgi:hypothetical protein
MKALLRHTKRIFRLFFLIAGFLIVLLLGFHFWFIYHSEKTIEDLITWASDGKLRGSMKKFKIDYINNNIDIKELTIFNTDSLAQSTSYRFSTKDFHLRIRSRWQLIFNKKLLIDSVFFNAPDIIVTRRGPRQKDTTNKKLLLAEELGNVYRTISNSLTVLNLQRFEISEGKVQIQDLGEEKKKPFRLSHIFLSIDKLIIDSTDRPDSSHFIFSDRIILRITNQNILLPDNTSSVAFNELLIDSKRRLVRIKHPVVSILPLPGQQSSFTASAESLDITGLDFNGLYQKQLIKADSVLILKPAGKLELYTNEKRGGSYHKKRTPVDSALLQLPLAIDIGHLVLLHGDGVMYLRQPGRTTTFQTKNDNISILGLRINDSVGNPLSIDGFNYTIRDYTGYTPDSIYRIQFSSLQFRNNSILLYDFKASTLKKSRTTLIREYEAPRFEITGMDWFSFIFDNHFIAKSATLYDPVLRVEKNDFFHPADITDSGKKKSIYQTLSIMDSILDLEELRIVNGEFSYKMGNNLDLNLQKLNLYINADELTQAKSINQILGSVKQLSFDTATISNLTAMLLIKKSNFNYSDKTLSIEKVVLNLDNGYTKADFDKVAIRDFSFDNQELEVNGFRWGNANMHIAVPADQTEKTNMSGNKAAFFLRNISGNNTAVFLENKKTSLELFINTLSANQILKESGKRVAITGLRAAGNKANLTMPDSRIRCSGFNMEDGSYSFLENLQFEQYSKKDSLAIYLSTLGFIPFFNKSLEKGIILVDSVVIKQAAVFLTTQGTGLDKKAEGGLSKIPSIQINRLGINDVSLRLILRNSRNEYGLECKNLSMGIDKISTREDNALLIRRISIHDPESLLLTQGRMTIKTSPAILIDLDTLLFQPGTKDWRLGLDRLALDSIQYSLKEQGKQESAIDMANIVVHNLSIGNHDLQKLLPWLLNRSGGVFQLGSFHWKDQHNDLFLKDIRYAQPERRLLVSSLWADPGKNREDFIRELVYRKDYLQVNSGHILVDGIGMDQDSLRISQLHLENAVLNIYSDKLKKPGPESLQPLPVSALKLISIPLQIEKVELKNIKVNYTELNEDTKQTGLVFFDRINGTVSNIYSKPNPGNDSLNLTLKAKFLDSMDLHMRMEESYTDPMGGMRIRLQLGPGDFHQLNSFLVPLVSIRARSGYLDTLNMTATGNEFVSEGSMQMYYHGLKADLLDSGNLQKRKFGTKVLSFITNSIALKKGNHSRTVNFKFLRMRKKSTVGYFLKMVVQGASRTVAPLSKILYRKENKKDAKNAGSQK